MSHTIGWTWTPRLLTGDEKSRVRGRRPMSPGLVFPPGLGFLSEVRHVPEFPKRLEGNLAGRRRAGPRLTPRSSQGTEHLG